MHMFQFGYFVLFVILGFGVGVTNFQAEDIYYRHPIDALNPLFNLIGLGAIIWSFFAFGFSWGLLSLVEMFFGYLAGIQARRMI